MPKLLTFRDVPPSDIQLIIHGQGVVLFNAAEGAILTFYDADSVSGIQVQLTEASVNVTRLPSMERLVDANNKRGLTLGASYWFSLDAQNQRLSAGLGEARMDTIIYKYQLSASDKGFLETLTHVQVQNATVMKLLRDPITRQVPLLIKPTDNLTMNDIAGEKIVAKSHLPATGHKLFDCISGKNFVLDDADFPDFSQAIEYSIANPNGWCYKRLQEKSREFDKDRPNELETYLRITIGSCNGESPGIPYVLEIWPPSHYSPIHNHGSANAIIRVLHGGINVSLYPYLGANVEPFGKVDFKKDDITWLSTSLNQVHKLTNIQKETCITIQCYLYDEEDNAHYDYFDYIDGLGRRQQYEPDSDMDFIDFKRLMKEEWIAKPNKKCGILKRMLCRGLSPRVARAKI